MKKKLLTIAAVLCAVGIPMGIALGKDVTKTYTAEYGAGGDTVKEAITEIDNEITLIYDLLGGAGGLYQLQAGNSAPTADVQTNDLWLDTRSTPPTLRYYDGDSFEVIAGHSSAIFSSTLSIDDTFRDFSSNVILRRKDSSTLYVDASSDDPATVGVASGEIYQATSDVELSVPGTTATGKYDIIAEGDTGTTFKLGLKGSPYTVGAGEQIIGQVYYNTDTNDFVWVRSYEQPKAPDAQAPYGSFHANASTNSQSFSNNTYETAELVTEQYDYDDTFNNSTYTYAPARAGLYELHGSCAFNTNVATDIISAALYKNDTLFVEDYRMGMVNADSNRRNDETAAVHATVESDGDDAFILKCLQKSGGALTSRNTATTYGTAMWGHYLGRKY